MAKKTYMGVDGKAEAIKTMYFGVDGVAKRIKKAYYGVGGVAKLVYASENGNLQNGTSTFIHSGSFDTPTGSYNLNKDYYIIQIEKYDTTPLNVYFDGELVATSTTTGDQTLTIDGAGTTLSSKGTITVTVTSESVYGLGEQEFYQFWKYDSADKYDDGNDITYRGNMDSATLGDNVTKIYNYAFDRLSNMSSLSIPSRGLVTIGANAFSGKTSLTSFTIPSSVTTIEENAFFYTGLTSINISANVTSVSGGSFKRCFDLTSISVDAQNQQYMSKDGALFDKSCRTLLTFPGGITGSYTTPNTVTTVGDYAFYDTKLTSLSMPNVTSIGNYACSNLSVLLSTTKLSSVSMPKVISIGESAFSNGGSLTSIEIPSSATTIGKNAFYSCGSLTSIVIPSSVATIGDGAFSYCGTLKEITFNHSASNSLSIGAKAFSLNVETATTVRHKGNASVLNYDWATDKRTVTFTEV